MAASSGYSPIIFETFESMATRPAFEKVTQPFMITARNIRYVADDVTIRPGMTTAFLGTDPTKNVTSIAQLTLTSGQRVQLGFDAGGNLFREDLGSIKTGLGANLFMHTATAQHRAYFAFSDLKTGQAAPKVYYQYSNVFYVDNLAVAPNTAPPTNGASDVVAGDVDTGTRYCVVLFKTRTGYVSGCTDAAVFPITITSSNQSLLISGVPLGPANCIARELAFTQANVNSAGPYFRILTDDIIDGLNRPVVNGVNIPATIINDNFTTTISVNFTDDYLVGADDVTSFFDKIVPANQKHVFYSETLDRMFLCGEDADTWRVSEPSDFETFFGTTGLIQPAFGNGGISQGTIEYKNEVYLLKDNGGHVVTPIGDTPSQWGTYPRWKKIGPCGPRAFDAGNEFLIFVHKSGLYVYQGVNPTWVTYWMTGRKTDVCWDNINWNYQHLIYAFIDEDSKTVRIGVPMDGSTSINVEFVVDYSRGWQQTRWSYDDKANSMILRADRTITSPNVNTPTDNRIATAQILAASSSGRVMYEDPTSTTDDGWPILENVRLAYTPYQKDPGIYQIGAVDVTAGGVGSLEVIVHPRQEAATTLPPLELTGPDAVDHDTKIAGQNERWSIEVTNGNVLGDWFTLQRVIVWVQMVWKTRTV
jgi:hypothetical protein